MIEPAQIRAARALLNISQADLSQMSEVGIATIKRLEGAPDVLRITAGVLLRVQTALEQAGVEFLFADAAAGCGVRLRRAPVERASARRPATSAKTVRDRTRHAP